jgi:hypothetical protein
MSKGSRPPAVRKMRQRAEEHHGPHQTARFKKNGDKKSGGELPQSRHVHRMGFQRGIKPVVSLESPLARLDRSRLPPYRPGVGNESAGFPESKLASAKSC